MANSFEDLIKKLNQGSKPVEEEVPETRRRGPILIELKEAKVYRLRILANLKDVTDVPFVNHFIHLGFEHPNFGKKTPLVCRGKECPLCAFYRRREKGGDAEAWRYKCNSRWLYYVLFINDQGQEEIGLLSVNYYAQEAIKNKIVNELKNKLNIFDLVEGRWLNIDCVKIEKKMKYVVGVETEFHRVSPALRKQLEGLKPLEKIYKDFDYTVEQLKKILKGEKLTISGGGSKPANKPAPVIKKAEPKIDMKFASDEVESIDDIKDSSPKTVLETKEEKVPDNYRRLSDILRDEDE